LTEICDVTAAIIGKLFTCWLDPLHDIFFLSSHFDMLLSDEFQEFAHLFSSWVISLVIVATAWAVLIMSFTVCAQQMLYNRLEFWSEMAL
jgi:hypothetical protein